MNRLDRISQIRSNYILLFTFIRVVHTTKRTTKKISIAPHQIGFENAVADQAPKRPR